MMLTMVGATALVLTPALSQARSATPLNNIPKTQVATAGLGDLTSYKAIAVDILAMIKKGDIAAAQKRGTDLETAWDKAEDKMKPSDPVKWRVVDKAIDRVLAQLRATKPDVSSCAAALTDLNNAIDSGGAA